MIRNKCWSGALIAAAVTAFTATAVAQVTPEQQSAIRGACRSDFMSKCSGVTPGGKEALQCLQTNVAGLSPACKTAVSATIPPPAAPPRQVQAQTPPPAPAAAPPAPPAPAPTATAAPAAAPSPPPASTTPTVRQVAPKPAQIGKPPTLPPAAPKQAAVPPQAAPVAAPAVPPVPTAEQMAAIKFTCRREFANNCRGVPAGGSEAIDCLQGNPSKLTPDCKTSLAALGDARPATPGTPSPAPAGTPNAPIIMTAVIGRSCMRDLLLHCRDVKVGDGRKIACLQERGPALSPLCKAALKITDPVR
jgi:hypothetical protein